MIQYIYGMDDEVKYFNTVTGTTEGVHHMAFRDLMGMVADSTSWTGRSSPLAQVANAHMQQSHMQQSQSFQEMLRQQVAQQGLQMYGPQASPVETLGSGEVKDRYEITDHTPDAQVIEIEKPPVEKPIPSQLTEIKTDLKEYAELATIVGIQPAELTIETFKAFLHEHDIPVFNLKEVIAYMDDKAKKESKNQAGWEWRPLRSKDELKSVWFGTHAQRSRDSRGYEHGPITTPASDSYRGGTTQVYDKLVPLHALKKVALIGKHFGDKVSMFVCDYAPIPAIQCPDPFLMAVIANPKIGEGEGRWVVDFWDEPGFGLSSQLK